MVLSTSISGSLLGISTKAAFPIDVGRIINNTSKKVNDYAIGLRLHSTAMNAEQNLPKIVHVTSVETDISNIDRFCVGIFPDEEKDKIEFVKNEMKYNEKMENCATYGFIDYDILAAMASRLTNEQIALMMKKPKRTAADKLLLQQHGIRLD